MPMIVYNHLRDFPEIGGHILYPQRHQTRLPRNHPKSSFLGCQQPQPKHRPANAPDRGGVPLTCEVK